MRTTGYLRLAAAACSVFVVGAIAQTEQTSEASSEVTLEMVAQGKRVAYDRKKGNCLACHMMDDGTLPGTIGPPLFAMRTRFPDRAALRAQIHDPTERNPNTMMPPFGKHRILSDEEIDQITEYVYSL
jgi:sulfur-oxidizing protein SoxX